MQTMPPAITVAPVAPLRNDRATFSTRVDAYVTWMIASVAQFSAVASNVYANAVDAYTSAVASASSAATATNQANIAAAKAVLTAIDVVLTNANAAAAAQAIAATLANANAAAQSESNAQGFASIAQAVSYDTPIRVNASKVVNDFTLPSGYNAVSAGPIEIAQNITVTILDNAMWSIV